MPGTGLSPRKLSRVTVSGSGGIWGQILCSCFSSYVINGLWWVLSRSFVLGAVPMQHAQFLVPQLSRLTAACPVRLWSHSSSYFALGCRQPPDSWLPNWVHFLFDLWPAQSSSPGFNILVPFCPSPQKKPSVCQLPPRWQPWLFPVSGSSTPSRRPVHHPHTLQQEKPFEHALFSPPRPLSSLKQIPN